MHPTPKAPRGAAAPFFRFVHCTLYFVLYAAAAVLLSPLNAVGAEPANETEVSVTESNGGGGISPESVGLIITGLLGGMGVGGFGTLGLAKKFTAKIDPQPLAVKLEEKFATREELAALKQQQAEFEKEMRGLLRDSEKRSHSRMDIISSKLDRVIGMLSVALPSNTNNTNL